MINTIHVKKQQLRDGFFKTGSGKTVIFILGSCRVINYVNYLHNWNMANGDIYTIISLDPFNWNWNQADERVDMEAAINNLEGSKTMRDMIRSVDIFIHEYYKNFGMFNCDKDGEKNIYQFGMNPKADICIPNWHDVFVLFGDILTFDKDLREKALQDYTTIGQLSKQTIYEVTEKGATNMSKFYEVCRKSDFPEMEEYFREKIKTTRLFHTYNHVSKRFTLYIFELMNQKWLHLDLLKGFDPQHEDMFADPHTDLTTYDKEYYGLNWDEPLMSLKKKLFA